ncbi:branched-chain amino acid ABC transporter permease [Lolliginicoccus lacisalsi]|uniref:branched-chain amino acid ABC transporter permease n=1 Tax=Lolliginicoccus lacisalsi TaxID=2742202 RepID=UPI002FD79925
MTHTAGRRGASLGGAALATLLLALLSALLASGFAHAQDPSDDPPAATGTVQGTLINAGNPVAGATLTATDETGAESAEATSDERGRWSMTLAPGTYTITLVEASLPPDVLVQTSERTATVRADRVASVIYTFGDIRSGLNISMGEKLLRLTIEGLRFGLVIAITAVGLSLIFGTTGLTNFAHGELVTIGAVAAWVANLLLGEVFRFGDGTSWGANLSLAANLGIATIIAIIVGIIVGLLNNSVIWRPLRRRGASLVAQLVVSIGLALALRAAILLFFSDRSQAFTTYQAQRQLEFGPVAITPVNLGTMVISLAVLVAVALMFKMTRIGKAMRAVADNRDLAASSGINVERVIAFVWALGGGLAALGGVLFAVSELNGTVQFEMGFKLLLLMFAGIILGGLGTAYGALLGCVLLGLLVQWSTLIINPDLKYTGGLLVLILVLVLRPQGILGSRTRVG